MSKTSSWRECISKSLSEGILRCTLVSLLCAICAVPIAGEAALAGESHGAEHEAPLSPTASEDKRFNSLLLLPFKGQDGLEKEAEKVTHKVEVAVRGVGRFRIFTLADMAGLEQIADEHRKVGCFESSACMAEIAAKAGSDLVLSGDVGLLAGKLVVNLRLQHGKEAQVLARERVQAGKMQKLLAALPELARKLLAGVEGQGETLHVALDALGNSPSFAVMDLKPQGVEPATAESLTDAIAVELSQFQNTTVFTRKDMVAMLEMEMQKQSLGTCDDISCMAEIGGAMGVRFILAGSVNKLEARYFVNVRIIDTHGAKVIGSESESFEGPADELLVGMRFLARRLFEVPYVGKGRLRLSIAEEEATVRMDNAELGITPALAIPEQLAAGKYVVEVEKPGFFPLRRELYVEPARVTSLQLDLMEKPTPWYKTWWFWTLTGVVVAGAGTAAALVATSGDSPLAGGELTAGGAQQ